MLLQKTLHMSQPLGECKARLGSIQSYRRQFLMVTRATVTSSKTVDFSFRGPFGFEAHTVLLSIESESPDQYAFESAGGNIALMGIVDVSQIRPNCTAVTRAFCPCSKRHPPDKRASHRHEDPCLGSCLPGDSLYSHGVFSIEAKNLARLKSDCCLGVVNLDSADLHAALFDQS